MHQTRWRSNSKRISQGNALHDMYMRDETPMRREDELIQHHIEMLVVGGNGDFLDLLTLGTLDFHT